MPGQMSEISESSERRAKPLEGQHNREKHPQADEELSNPSVDGPSSARTTVAVWWDEPEDKDPENPMNWSQRRKWTNILIVSAMTVIAPLASSMFAPSVPQVMTAFRSNNEQLATFVVSVYILGFAFGPLAIAPLSEMYGRLPVYHISNLLFIILTILCGASQNLGMLITFRFLAGCFGATPMTLGGGTIADLLPAAKRARAMSIWSIGPLLGPSIGPIAGGYLSGAAGWRWIFWTLAIATGVISAIGLAVMRETYAPAILARKAVRLQNRTGDRDFKSKLDTGLSGRDRFLNAIVRPTKMLLFALPVTLLSIYISFTYAVLYILFTTLTYVFADVYHFASGPLGLTFIGTGVGMLIGLAVMGLTSDQILKRGAKTPGGAKPELRLTPLLMLPGGLCMPVGLFIYGWTVERHTHWIAPMIGTALVGIGQVISFMTISTYLIDVYTRYAASALAANTVLRSIFGALMPLAALHIYDHLGYGWGNSVLAFVGLALYPLPLLFHFYGARIRENSRFQPQM